MKKLYWRHYTAAALSVFSVTTLVSAQGTVSFDGAANFSGRNYSENGMLFSVITPSPGDYDRMAGLPPIASQSNVPYNSTPYMVFFRDLSPDDYVSFGLTSGSSFGLSSVQLADPHSPSSTLLPITFIGTKADGSTVTMPFTTPGGGANTLTAYYFNSDFASGLTSVQIQSTGWAMDNLVVVPEPGTLSLLFLGLVAGWKTVKRRG